MSCPSCATQEHCLSCPACGKSISRRKVSFKDAFIVGTALATELILSSVLLHRVRTVAPNEGTAGVACPQVASTPALPVPNRILPPGSFEIERVDLASSTGAPRALILWMVNPRRYHRSGSSIFTSCALDVSGSYFSGPTRVSLLDLRQNRIINTIVVKSNGSQEDTFMLPTWVRRLYYEVPNVDDSGHGRPRIMNLKDLKGVGAATDFLLYDTTRSACGTVATAALGYSSGLDRVVEYPIEATNDRGDIRVSLWALQKSPGQDHRLGF